MKVKSLSRVRLLATPWTVAYQASPSLGFSRQEYQSGLPFPSPEDLLDPGIKPGSPALQADAIPSEPPGKPNIPSGIHKKRKKSACMQRVSVALAPRKRVLSSKEDQHCHPQKGVFNLYF